MRNFLIQQKKAQKKRSEIINAMKTLICFLFSLQMAATIDMNFQSDLMAIFEENLFWGQEQLKHNCKKRKEKKKNSKRRNFLWGEIWRTEGHGPDVRVTAPRTENKRWTGARRSLCVRGLERDTHTHTQHAGMVSPPVSDVISWEHGAVSRRGKRTPSWQSGLCHLLLSARVATTMKCRRKDVPITMKCSDNVLTDCAELFCNCQICEVVKTTGFLCSLLFCFDCCK